MPQIDLTARELTILEFVLMDLAEAIDDGDRPEFNAQEVEVLLNKCRLSGDSPSAANFDRTTEG
jgi:hypothetical protein